MSQGLKIKTWLTEILHGKNIYSVSGDGKTNTFLRMGVGELEVAEALTTLSREGVFKEKQCNLGRLIMCP